MKVLILITALTFTACESSVSSQSDAQLSDSRTDAGQTSGTVEETATARSPIEELNEMDPRTPVPLQPMMAWHQKQNMMEHLVAIQRINDGLAKDDWGEVKAAASLIESSPQMQQTCQHMGAGAEGFTELALDFHRRADAISKAADEKNTKKTLAATATTLQACTSCHQSYRQEVVTAARWQELTGSEHQPPRQHTR